MPATETFSVDMACLQMKKKQEDSPPKTLGFFENMKDKPVMWVLFPIMIVFGFDLLLNIAVLTKRSLDFFVLGKAPSTEPWW